MPRADAYRGLADSQIPGAIFGIEQRPIDVARLALRCKVFKVHLGPSLSLGALLPVPRGFEMRLRSPDKRVADLIAGDRLDNLNRRQRFTVAHEVAHTFFFDLTCELPTPRSEYPPGRTLERTCDYAAGRMLVPNRLLEADMRGLHKLTGSALMRMRDDYGVGLVPLMCRVADLWNPGAIESGVVLGQIDSSGTDARVLACCYGYSLVRAIPPLPRRWKNKRLSAWLGKYLDKAFWTHSIWHRHRPVGSDNLVLRKFSFANSPGRFFLEIELRSGQFEDSRSSGDLPLPLWTG
jgi:hypothetical protein